MYPKQIDVTSWFESWILPYLPKFWCPLMIWYDSQPIYCFLQIQPWYQAFGVLLLHADYTSTTIIKALIKRIIASGDVNLKEFQDAMFVFLHNFVVAYKSDTGEASAKVSQFNQNIDYLSDSSFETRWSVACIGCWSKCDDSPESCYLQMVLNGLGLNTLFPSNFVCPLNFRFEGTNIGSGEFGNFVLKS